MKEAPYAVLMNGYTACLKTYAARRIANVLKIPLIETNRLGHCTGEDGLLRDDLRGRRYDIAGKLSAQLARARLPMVIDGTFNFRKWRGMFYPLLAENDINDIVIVRCVCDDEDIVQARINERSGRRILPENEAARMENYLKTRRDDESVYEDTLPAGGHPSVVEFRTGPDYTVEIRKGGSEAAKAIRELLWKSFHTGRLNEH
jgi:predicted kinase